MKVASMTAVLTAIVAIGSVATPSFAQDSGYYRGEARADAQACQATKHQDQTTGGIFGALIGAVVGSNLAAHSGGFCTGGALLGAAAQRGSRADIGVGSNIRRLLSSASQNYGYGQRPPGQRPTPRSLGSISRGSRPLRTVPPRPVPPDAIPGRSDGGDYDQDN